MMAKIIKVPENPPLRKKVKIVQTVLDDPDKELTIYQALVTKLGHAPGSKWPGTEPWEPWNLVMEPVNYPPLSLWQAMNEVVGWDNDRLSRYLALTEATMVLQEISARDSTGEMPKLTKETEEELANERGAGEGPGPGTD